MALEISKQHTALLAMDFENDIVHPEGAFKDFGFAQMVADNSVLDKTSQLLAAARGAGPRGRTRQHAPRWPKGSSVLIDICKLFRQYSFQM